MRTLSRLLAPLVALALMTAVVLFAIEVVAAGVGAKPVVVPWHGAYDAAKRNSWTDAGPIVICIALIVIGLLLLATQTARRRVTDHALSDRSAGVDASLSTRGLRSAVRGAATSLDGVSSAKLTIRRRKGKLKATSHGSDRTAAAGLEAPLRTALDERLAGAELARPPRITVTVTPGKAAS
jgi:hypothetical protein